MTICTIDVHSRDVVGKLISSKIESVLAFMWQSQLRHRWAGDYQDTVYEGVDYRIKPDITLHFCPSGE